MAVRPLPYGCAELIEWDWPAPIDLTVREACHMIEMSLPPFAADGVCSFPAVDPTRFRFMGSMFVRPAGVELRTRSQGGRIRVVRLAVAPDAGGAARALALAHDQLATGLDLRAAAPRFLFQRIRDELLCPGVQSDRLLRAYADALLIEIERTIAARRVSNPPVARLADWQYNRVLERIECGEMPPGVSELAALCGLSVRHFTRLYHGLTGESPARTIERVRMRRAMALLMDDALPVKVIAGRLGYAHDSAFSAAFRRSSGTCPSGWRQRQRAAAN